MYAHQVIDQIKLNYKESSLKTTYEYYLKTIVPKIRESVCFHLDDMVSVVSMMRKLKIIPSFLGRRLPFKQCWFDLVDGDDRYAKSTDLDEIQEGFVYTTKRAIYCEEFCKDVLYLVSFNYVPKVKEWRCVPIEAFISTNNYSLANNEEFLQKTIGTEGYIFNQLGGKIIFRYIPDKDTVFSNSPGKLNEQQLTDAFAEDMLIYYGFLLTALNLLQCKNIVTVNNYPSDKLNKKKLRTEKEPSYVFKTLMVKPLRNLKFSNNDPESLKGLTKLHIAMGHFKTYTEEKPLFGKYPGKFWWQDQVRGNIKNGMVVKDYHLLTE